MKIKFPWLSLSLLLLFFIATSLPVIGQTLHYDIYKGGDKVGNIIVKKTVQEDKVLYEANSESHFNIFFENELITQSSAEFVQDEMAYSMAKIIFNGKLKEHAITKKDGDSYSYYQHPEKTTYKKSSPFRISTLILYYVEPSDINLIFSENFQELCPIKPLGNHTYELTLPGGKINHYIYEAGELMEVKVFRTFVDLSFRRQKTAG